MYRQATRPDNQICNEMVVLHLIHELYQNDPKKAAWSRQSKGVDANLLRWFRLTQIHFLQIWSLSKKKECFWIISSIWYVCKIFQKENISYPLLRNNSSYPLLQKGMCAYQGVRNVGFSGKVSDLLNEWYKKFQNQKPFNPLIWLMQRSQ